jgi:hypothetical protein
VRQFQEGQRMPFVSWFEQEFLNAADQGKIEGEIKGLHQGIRSLLKARFGADGEALAGEAHKQTNPEWLRGFLSRSETGSLDELRKLLP